MVPLSRPEGGINFNSATPMLRVFADDGRLHGRPIGQQAAGVSAGIADVPLVLLVLMLATFSDDRVAVSREPPPAKVNAARAKHGRAPIPAQWRVGTSPILDPYTTKIGARQRHGESRGGHHASPIAHDRRGHQRRLRSGRTVWVRPSRVGEFVRHLTRRRGFLYQVEGGGGS